jgi:large subunit ribosomal protein L15
MTKYNELKVTALKNTKRVGRGIASGQGKTAGRGTKGQKARTGHSQVRATFAGGSGSLVRRTPKSKGFKSIHASAQVVYLDHLNELKGKKVDNFTLFEAGLISTPYQSAKIILRGELTEKVDVFVSGASKSVKAAIVKNGGSFTKTAVPLEESTKADKASK